MVHFPWHLQAYARKNLSTGMDSDLSAGQSYKGFIKPGPNGGLPASQVSLICDSCGLEKLSVICHNRCLQCVLFHQSNRLDLMQNQANETES